MRLGLCGFVDQGWCSVNRTLKFYLEVLSKKFDLVFIKPDCTTWSNEKYDAVVNFNTIQGWEFKKHPNFPIIFVMNGGVVLDQNFIKSASGKLCCSDVFIVNCKSDVLALKNIFGSKSPEICHLPLPVNVEIFKCLDKKTSRNRISIEDSDYIIGFVGRLLPQKNLHIFLRMFYEIKKRLYPKKVFAIINGKFWCDYPILPYVTELYPKNILHLMHELKIENEVYYFTGKLTDNDLARFYNSMDLMIHPTNSIDENFGYAPVEAMACGIPVVGAAYGGLKDTILSGITGYLMPTWITEAGIRMDYISGIINSHKILIDSLLRDTMSKNAIERVNTNYTIEKSAEILCKTIFQSIVNRKQKRKNHTIELNLSANSLMETQEFLPVIEKSWQYYSNIVSYYVSTATPVLNYSSSVRLAAPIKKQNNQKFTLCDDAWPACYSYSMKVKCILKKCTDNIKVSELLDCYNLDIQYLNILVKIGLLIVTYEKYE